MNEQHFDTCVSFETAKLLKEKGFAFPQKKDDPDEYGHGYRSYFQLRSNPDRIKAISHFYANTNQNINQWVELNVPAPTHAQAVVWLQQTQRVLVHLIPRTSGNHMWGLWKWDQIRVLWEEVQGRWSDSEEAIVYALNKFL